MSTFFNDENVASGKTAGDDYVSKEPENKKHIEKMFWLVDNIHKILVILSWSQELMEKAQQIKSKSRGEMEDNNTVQWNRVWNCDSLNPYSEIRKIILIKADVRELGSSGS